MLLILVGSRIQATTLLGYHLSAKLSTKPLWSLCTDLCLTVLRSLPWKVWYSSPLLRMVSWSRTMTVPPLQFQWKCLSIMRSVTDCLYKLKREAMKAACWSCKLIRIIGSPEQLENFSSLSTDIPDDRKTNQNASSMLPPSTHFDVRHYL